MAGLSQKSKLNLFHNNFVKFVEEVLESSPCQRASIAKVASRLVQSGLCKKIVNPHLQESWALGAANKQDLVGAAPMEPSASVFRDFEDGDQGADSVYKLGTCRAWRPRG